MLAHTFRVFSPITMDSSPLLDYNRLNVAVVGQYIDNCRAQQSPCPPCCHTWNRGRPMEYETRRTKIWNQLKSMPTFDQVRCLHILTDQRHVCKSLIDPPLMYRRPGIQTAGGVSLLAKITAASLSWYPSGQNCSRQLCVPSLKSAEPQVFLIYIFI